MARKVTKIHTSSHPVAKNKILRPSSKNIAHAAQSLRKGGIVVFPTETVYGLAANAMNDDSVAKVFQIKNGPPSIL